MPTKFREFVAEIVGVFAIVFVGGASIMMSARTNSQAGVVAGGLCYAFTVAAMVAAFYDISAHFNPAVTVASVVTRRTGLFDGITKIAAQLIGGIAGAFFLKATFPAQLLTSTRVGGTSLAMDVTFGQGIALEAATTALLMLTVLGVTSREATRGTVATIVGFVVGALIFAIGPLTGASFNPARSFGPALASGIWEGHAVYWIGPVFGAVAGALIWDFMLQPREAVTLAEVVESQPPKRSGKKG